MSGFSKKKEYSKNGNQKSKNHGVEDPGKQEDESQNSELVENPEST